MRDERNILSFLKGILTVHPRFYIGQIRKIGLIVSLFILASCGATPLTTVTSVPEGGPVAFVNDSLYAQTLVHCLDANGAISYTKLRGDSDLSAYLREISRIRIDGFTSRWQEIAFWLNAHNAYVLDIIRSNPPVHSIDDITAFRRAKVALIGGTFYSLNDIEHSIFTTRFREPRAFFALYDAAKSSPPLRPEPYYETKLSDQLDDQTRKFLADSTKNTLDRHSNVLYLSQRFSEYSDEITAITGTMLDFVRAFATGTNANWISSHPSVRLAYLTYDNSLNANDIEQPHEQQPAPRKQPVRRPSGGIR